MSRFENVELTTLCMVYHKDLILLQNRTKKDWQGYTFPGGHVEAQESFVDAVIREVKEETGLDIFHPILCGIKQFPIQNGRYIVLLFKTNQFHGSLTSSLEGEMKWVDRHDLSSLPLVDDFMELLRVFDDPHIQEFQYTVDNEWHVHLK
jgi:ADP-ribose pyrophosphatase